MRGRPGAADADPAAQRRRPARAGRDRRGAARPSSCRPTCATRRGRTSRCRSAPGRRSRSRSWWRACASCSSSPATRRCSTSAPARATTPRCSRGWRAHVYSIEVHASLSRQAAENLRAAGVENVTLEVGDGSRGLPRHAPYEAINVAAAAGGAIPPALAEQLAPGGRLVAPVEAGDQRLVVARRTPEGVDAHPARARALRAAVGGCHGTSLRRWPERRGLGRSSRPTLPPGPAVDHHHVGREVVRAADQRGADAVGVDRHVLGLELADAVGGEAAGDDDLHVAVAGGVEPFADEPHELGVDAGRRVVAVALLEPGVGQLVGRVEPDAPQVAVRARRPPRARCRASGWRSRRAP